MYSVNLDLTVKIISEPTCIYHIYSMYDSIFLPSGLKATSEFVYCISDFILKKYEDLVRCIDEKTLDGKISFTFYFNSGS